MNTDKAMLYEKAYNSLLDRYNADPERKPKETLKKLIFYGVKIVNHTKALGWDDPEYNFKFAEVIKCAMAAFTPRQFMTIFPINKEYGGERWETKDYFTTVKYLSDFGLDTIIGENINDFLWEYMNMEIHMFEAHYLGFASDLRQSQGYPGFAEEFFGEQGLTTHALHTDQKGKQFLIDNKTGKTMRVKPRVKHLRLVK